MEMGPNIISVQSYEEWYLLTGSSSNDAFGQMLSGPPPAQQQQPPPSSTSPDFGDFLGTPAPSLPATTQPIQQQQQPLLQAPPTQILQPQPSANLMLLNQSTAAAKPQQVTLSVYKLWAWLKFSGYIFLIIGH